MPAVLSDGAVGRLPGPFHHAGPGDFGAMVLHEWW
jgi:hypothetical protein